MAVVALDVDKFREYYPQFFESLTDAQLEGYFATACLILDNTNKSPVPYDPDDDCVTRETLLYLLMCHLATLGQRPNGVTGTMTSATEGSVSAGYSPLSWTGNNASWYAQTPCGQAFWQAMAAYRVGPIYYGERYVHPWG